jgi:hypothetical protein
VIEHIHRCPACARQAQELAALQVTLIAKLYRASCPTSDQLVAYQRGELRGNDKLTVAQHLRQCPHCARELAVLAHDKSEDVSSCERSQAAIEIHVVPGTVHPAPQVYQLCDTEIAVTQHASQTHPGRWDLSGRVQVGGQVPESIGWTTVELYHDGELIATAAVSPRGQFSFRDLEPGDYDLSLVGGGSGVRLEKVQDE